MNSEIGDPTVNDVQNPEIPAKAISTAPLISLATWIGILYSPADAPCLTTVRRWVRAKRISPAPEKQGRSYFFHPSARYVACRASEENL